MAMTYTLQKFCSDAHDAIAEDMFFSGRDKLRKHLELLLRNKDFIEEHLLSQKTDKSVLYHDKDFDFYVMAHGTDSENRVGKPHDHGSSWAVYGQGTGTTNMTIWDRKDDGSKIGYAELIKEKTFSLTPGRAALFDIGVIHSTAHPKPARWVRVTGTDLDSIERYAYDPKEKLTQLMTVA